MDKHFWTLIGLPVLGGVTVVACLWAFWPTSEDESRILRNQYDKQNISGVKPGDAQTRKAQSAKKKEPEQLTWPTWVPTSEEDRIVEKFRVARNDAAKGGMKWLPAAPVLNEKTAVSDAEADAIQADYYLRNARKIVEVRRGEPKQGGGWTNTSKRYTLATRIEGPAPDVRIKNGDKIEPITHLFMVNPDIIVEIHDGKLRALRAELHRD